MRAILFIISLLLATSVNAVSPSMWKNISGALTNMKGDTLKFKNTSDDTVRVYFDGDYWVLDAPRILLGGLEDVDILFPHADTILKLQMPESYIGSGADSSDRYSFIHPSVYRSDTALWGYKIWFVGSPFDQATGEHENPTVRASNDNVTWDSVTGTSDPLWVFSDVNPPGVFSDDPTATGGGLSDPEFVFWEDTGWVYFRADYTYSAAQYADSGACPHRVIWVTKSINGSSWSSPTKVLYDTCRSFAQDYISPCVIPGDTFTMFTVELRNTPAFTDSQHVVVKWKTDTADGLFAYSDTVDFRPFYNKNVTGSTEPTVEAYKAFGKSINIWHLDILKGIRGDTSVLIAAVTMSNYLGSRMPNGWPLYIAVSYDSGASFDVRPEPIVVRDTTIAWQYDIYKSCLIWTDSTMRTLGLYYSGSQTSWGALADYFTAYTTYENTPRPWSDGDRSYIGLRGLDPSMIGRGGATKTSIIKDVLRWDGTVWSPTTLDSTSMTNASTAEDDLVISNSPTDEYALTWEADAGSGGQMTWEAQSGNETITLSGDATGNGTTAITVTVVDDLHDHVYSNIDATTSANWAGRVSDETGTGAWVFGTTPTLTTGVDINLAATDNVTIDARTNNRTVTVGALRLNHTPQGSTPGTRAIYVDVNANSVPSTQGIHVSYKATALAAGETGIGIDVEGVTSSSTGGDIQALHVSKSGIGSAEVHAIHASAGVHVIDQLSGAFTSPTQAWGRDTSLTAWANLTSPDAVGSSAIDSTLFEEVDDYLYIGNTLTFSEIDFVFNTFAGGSGINPTFEFSIAGPGWTAFTPIDNTDGCRQDGEIEWAVADLTSWASVTVNSVASYYIRILRNQGGAATDPIEDRIRISVTTEYQWNSDGDVNINSLGIGIDSPSSALHIKANTPGTVGSHPAGQLIIQDPDDAVFGNVIITGYESDGAGNPDQQLWYLGSSSGSNSDISFLNRRNANLHLGTNGTPRMTIDGAGDIAVTGTVDGVDIAALNTGVSTDSSKWRVPEAAALTNLTTNDPLYKASAGVVACSTATTSIRGVAKFDSENFAVTSGNVAIKAGGISTGNILNQTITKADTDTTASDFVFDDAYRGTSAVSDSAYTTKKYVDDAAGGLTDQAVKGNHVDSTAEDFVFVNPYKGTSAVSDSVLTTRKEIGDTATAIRGDFPAAQDFADVLGEDPDGGDIDQTSLGKLEFYDAGLYLDADADGVMNITSDGTLELHSADWDITTTGIITNTAIDADNNAITNIGDAAVDNDITIDQASDVDSTGTDIAAALADRANIHDTLTKSFSISAIDDTWDWPFWMTPKAITIIAASGVCIAGTNVVGVLMEYDNDAANPAVCNSSDWTFTTGEERTTSLSNASIDAGDYLGWKTTSVSGEVTFFTLTFEYTVD